MTDTTTIPPPSPATNVANATAAAEQVDESWGDTKKILALLYSLAFVLVIVLLLFVSPKTDPQIFAVLTTLLGVLANQVSQIVSHYFGSTKNSQTKDATIQMLSNPPTVKVTP